MIGYYLSFCSHNDDMYIHIININDIIKVIGIQICTCKFRNSVLVKVL